MQQGAPLLSVVVPAWNEADRIGPCLDQLRSRLAHLDPEVIVVDDGSRDGTAEACADWIRGHPGLRVSLLARPHRGKGAAVRSGVMNSRGAVVAYIDADMDIGADEIDRLLQVREHLSLDVVAGSKRRLAWNSTPRPLARKVLSLVFSRVVRILFRLPIEDTQTGVKLFGGPWLREAVRQASVPGFLFDLELLAAAAEEGLRIGEVQVTVDMRRPASRIGLVDLVRCAAELGRTVVAVARMRRRRKAEQDMRRRPEPGSAASRGRGVLLGEGS